MAMIAVSAFERSQLQQALDHCQEAAALGGRLHTQLEHVLLGYTPEALSQLQNIHQRFSVMLARVSCARDQLAGLLSPQTEQDSREAQR